MENPLLYRKRYIPNETICLKDDEIVYRDENKIITKWRVLKPRADFAFGKSCFFLDKGYKVSKFIHQDGHCVCYYCDIIQMEYILAENSYIFQDLLVDVKVYPDGFVEVLDLAEVSQALDEGWIGLEIVQKILVLTDGLLKTIYEGNFGSLTKDIDLIG